MRHLHTLLARLALLTMVLLARPAQAAVFGNLEYVDNGIDITITGFVSEPVGNLVIPETIIGKPVRRIEDNAFIFSTSVTNLFLPNNLRTIGLNAFNGCSGITTLTIPSGVTTIEDGAFSLCSNLSTISLPTSLTSVGALAFWNCSSLTDISIPASLSFIHYQAFLNCPSLESFAVNALNPKFSSIDGVLFNKAQTSLIEYPEAKADSSYVIPDGVTAILDEAFRDCTLVNSITIPDSVFLITPRAFEGCTGLNELAVDPQNTSFSSAGGVLFNLSQTELLVYPQGKFGSNYEVPPTVTQIANDAFRSCSQLSEITLPFGLATLGDNAFADCTSLSTLLLPSTVSQIGIAAFSGCASLTTITIPDGVTSIGLRVFENCSELQSVVLPASVTTIDQEAFQNCIMLTSITGSLNLESIGRSSFESCDALTHIDFLNGALEIGESAFRECNGLVHLTIPASITTIQASAFRLCSNLSSVVVPSGVTRIEDTVFAQCTQLTQVLLPDGLDHIGVGAFQNCGIRQIDLPESLTSLGASAFQGSSLRHIRVPSGVSVISEFAFSNCPLETVTLSQGLETIRVNAFEACTQLTHMIIPASVTWVQDRAFTSCTSLVRVAFFGDEPIMNPISVFEFVPAFDLTIYYLNSNIWFSGNFGATGLDTLPELWRTGYFGSSESIGDGADSNDFDFDGMSNLLELAFGGNPRWPDSRRVQPVGQLAGADLEVSYSCNNTLDGVRYRVQASTSLELNDWADIATSNNGGPTQPTGGLSVVTDSGFGVRTVIVRAAASNFPGQDGYLRVVVDFP